MGLLASYSAPNEWCAEGNAERSRTTSRTPTPDFRLYIASRLADHVFSHGLQRQVRLAFVDLTCFRITERLFYRVILDEPVAAVQVVRERFSAFRGLRR